MTASAYSLLVLPTRRQTSTVAGRNLVEETESDRARVLFSSPFRRLQQKTQVFPLENNAAVRSRLTHSIEVAQLGRFVAVKALEKLAKSGNDVPAEQKAAILNLVETVCLIHDIGNPPFGHFGEAAIADWFRVNATSVAKAALGRSPNANEEQHISDFRFFDGNAQGFRIVTRLQWNRDEFGLNLTYSCLASYLKYCYASTAVDGTSKQKKKPGYFLSEEPIVEEMWKALGMRPHTRFPLAYVMEAADDIAFCISDIEDGIEKRLIAELEFFEALQTKWTARKDARATSSGDAEVSKIIADSRGAVQAAIEMRGFMQLWPSPRFPDTSGRCEDVTGGVEWQRGRTQRNFAGRRFDTLGGLG